MCAGWMYARLGHDVGADFAPRVDAFVPSFAASHGSRDPNSRSSVDGQTEAHLKVRRPAVVLTHEFIE
jgi:hypothetical protein